MSPTANTATSENHILIFYEDKADYLNFLAEYYKEGLQSGNLCVFVSVETADELTKEFADRGLDVRDNIKDGSFRVFNMLETYLQNGQFSSNYMLGNVEAFIKDAMDDGYRGLYTAGDLRWLEDRPEYAEEAATYESKINDLQSEFTNFRGVCLYPTAQSSTVRSLSLQTHPFLVMDGSIHPCINYALSGT